MPCPLHHTEPSLPSATNHLPPPISHPPLLASLPHSSHPSHPFPTPPIPRIPPIHPIPPVSHPSTICPNLVDPPKKTAPSRKLVSQDKKSNTTKYELTTLLEVAPLSKGDVVLTPRGLTGSVELMLVTKLQAAVHLINPVTLGRAECRATKYFAAPFRCASVRLAPTRLCASLSLSLAGSSLPPPLLLLSLYLSPLSLTPPPLYPA